MEDFNQGDLEALKAMKRGLSCWKSQFCLIEQKKRSVNSLLLEASSLVGSSASEHLSTPARATQSQASKLTPVAPSANNFRSVGSSFETPSLSVCHPVQLANVKHHRPSHSSQPQHHSRHTAQQPRSCCFSHGWRTTQARTQLSTHRETLATPCQKIWQCWHSIHWLGWQNCEWSVKKVQVPGRAFLPQLWVWVLLH